MYKNDYVLRMIEEFAKAVGVILGFKKNEDYKSAEEAVSSALKKFTETDIDFLLSHGEKELITELVEKRKLTEDQIHIIAELLYQTAEVKKQKGANEDLSNYYSRSLSLYQWLSINQKKVFSMEVLQRIQLLEQILI